jgi:hypothetical protein
VRELKKQHDSEQKSARMASLPSLSAGEVKNLVKKKAAIV